MNKLAGKLQGKGRFYTRFSENAAFKEVDGDGGDDDYMNGILWFNPKDNKKYGYQNEK